MSLDQIRACTVIINSAHSAACIRSAVIVHSFTWPELVLQAARPHAHIPKTGSLLLPHGLHAVKFDVALKVKDTPH